MKEHKRGWAPGVGRSSRVWPVLAALIGVSIVAAVWPVAQTRAASWGQDPAQKAATPAQPAPAQPAPVRADPSAAGASTTSPSAPAASSTNPSAPAASSANPSTGSTTSTTTTAQKKIQVQVQVVNVPVSVLDRKGRPVIDMKQSEFRVYENNQLQTIKYFSREPKPPLRIGLVLDTSNPMRPQLKFEKEAASDFVFNILEQRGSKNEIFLETFDSTSSIIQDFTSDPDLLNDKIHALKAGGGKALYDALYSACLQKMLYSGPPEQTRRLLVVITDGLDVQSTHTLDEAISMAHRAETVIYTIGNSSYGFDNPGDKILDELSERTGGAAFFPLEKEAGGDMETGYLSHGQIGDTSQNKGLGAAGGVFSAERLVNLAESLQSIEHELDDQYFIGYTPSNPALDGTYRSIRVEVLRPGVKVRSKTGYFAVAAEP